MKKKMNYFKKKSININFNNNIYLLLKIKKLISFSFYKNFLFYNFNFLILFFKNEEIVLLIIEMNKLNFIKIILNF
jgi:hypothetical protein